MNKGLKLPTWVMNSLAKSTRNDPNFICPICLLNSKKFLDFDEKMLHWASLVRGGHNKVHRDSKLQSPALINICTLTQCRIRLESFLR